MTNLYLSYVLIKSVFFYSMNIKFDYFYFSDIYLGVKATEILEGLSSWFNG